MSSFENTSAGSNNDWCTIESDPAVFTALLEELGVSGVEFQELWSLDDSSLVDLVTSAGGNVYGLIFLFQWKPEHHQQSSTTSTTNKNSTSREPLSESDIPRALFFAHQVTTNACATQAILSILLNTAQLTDVQKGPTLSEFQSFTQDFPPSLKGVAISSSEEIKKVHNSFSRPDAVFLTEGKIQNLPAPGQESEAFHFVAYVPFVDGNIYELDGLQKGPIVIGGGGGGTTNNNDNDALIPAWLIQARQAIQDRMALFDHDDGDAETQQQQRESHTAGSGSSSAIKFNLMAVIQDKRIVAAACHDEVALTHEQAKRNQWNMENQRRRHNYVALCLQMLRELAAMGKLQTLSQQAQQRHIQKKKQQQQDKKTMAHGSLI